MLPVDSSHYYILPVHKPINCYKLFIH